MIYIFISIHPVVYVDLFFTLWVCGGSKVRGPISIYNCCKSRALTREQRIIPPFVDSKLLSVVLLTMALESFPILSLCQILFFLMRTILSILRHLTKISGKRRWIKKKNKINLRTSLSKFEKAIDLNYLKKKKKLIYLLNVLNCYDFNGYIFYPIEISVILFDHK